MTRYSSALFVLLATLFSGGCAPFMVPVDAVDSSHFVDASLSKDQVKAAIIEGAENAGWRAKDLGDDKLLASFSFKSHAIHVEIDYTDTYYSTHYKSSYWMKMFCTEQDKKAHQNMIVSGRKDCPGNLPPSYIHKAYKQWVDLLNASIRTSLSTM